MERRPLSRGDVESSFNRGLGGSVLTFPHLRSTATAWVRREGAVHLRPNN